MQWSVPIVSAPGRLRQDEHLSPKVQGQHGKHCETHFRVRGGKKEGRKGRNEGDHIHTSPPKPQNQT